MTAIPVALGPRSYDVIVAAGAIGAAADHLRPWLGCGRLVVVTDENVAACHLAALAAAVPHIRIDAIILPPGESTKSWTQLEGLCDRLLALEIERDEAVIAFGGGVIGDLAGFAASIVKRGCQVIQIPTTLLAQVDSSVGGKTAINARTGKNLIGAFHQPVLVLIDPLTLGTLPVREIRAGYAEVVKYGLIDDPVFFDWCEANAAQLLAGDPAVRARAIMKSVAAKARIVGEDERETSGHRALLNLGHTFGHALEAETGFGGRLLHGEAVAAGIATAFRFSAARGLCSIEDAHRVTVHLASLGLPVSAYETCDATGKTLAAHMEHDKKKAGGTVPFILARGIGQAIVAKDVTLAEVAVFLDADRP